MSNYDLTRAFKEVQNLVEKTNKLITILTPWNLYKNQQDFLLKQALNYLANGLKIIAFSLSFFLPRTSKFIYKSLNIEKSEHY